MKAGRLKNNEIIKEIHYQKSIGKNTREIATDLDISLAMVQYYLRQKPADETIKVKVSSIAKAYWEATDEQRSEVDRILGIQKEQKITTLQEKEKTAEMYNKFINLETSLLLKVKGLFTGQISLKNMDAFFNDNEKEILNQSELFLENIKKIQAGETIPEMGLRVVQFDIVKIINKNK